MRISDWSSDVCSSDLKSRGHVQRIANEVPQFIADLARIHIFVAQRRKAIFGKIRAMAACQRCELNNLDGRVGIAHDEAAFRGCFHRIGTRSEEHTSELQSLMRISSAVFCFNNKR